MKRHQRKLFVGTAAAALVLTIPARSLFGVIVFDPSVFAKLVAESEKQIQQYVRQGLQLKQETQQALNSAQQLVNQAKQAMHFVQEKKLWMTLGQTAINDLTRNQFGETLTWPTMVNGQPRFATGAWTSATMSPSHLGFLSNAVPGSSQPLAQLASVEAQDGSAAKCLATIAEYRANAVANTNAIASLGGDQMDGSDDTNSEIEQLNLINAAQAQANNEARSQGAVEACLVEQQILAAKVQRDTLADHLTFVGKANDYTVNEQDDWTGAMNSLADYRNP